MSFPLGLTVHYIMALISLLKKNSLWSKGVVACRLTDLLELSQLVCFTAKISLKKIIELPKAKALKETDVLMADFQRERHFGLICFLTDWLQLHQC